MYPLARRAKHHVSISSSSIAPSQRYSKINFRQSRLEPDDLVISATSGPGSQPQPAGPSGVLGLVLGVGARSPSSGWVPGVGAELSSSSQMDDLMRSCMNMPSGGAIHS
jgi:hypothetical protein